MQTPTLSTMILCCPDEKEGDKENKENVIDNAKEAESAKSSKEISTTETIKGVSDISAMPPAKQKVTCDECRSRINFEIQLAAALEEQVRTIFLDSCALPSNDTIRLLRFNVRKY